MDITPLNSWTAKRISPDGHHGGLSVTDMVSYHIDKLRETISYVKTQSPFYRETLSAFSSDDLVSLADIDKIPFTTKDDLELQGHRFLCVSQSLIERVFTINVPGPVTKNSRVYFSSEDIERTIDFFHHGMTTFTEPGQTVMILMPGDRPDSVGDLLARSIGRIPARVIVHGLVTDPSHTISEIERNNVDVIVGIPISMRTLTHHKQSLSSGKLTIKSVLLTSDYMSHGMVSELEHSWGCEVFSHYGSTEMGFLGGVECSSHSGYHLTESDIYFEIIDPESGKIMEPGRTGEVVFTTLNRQAMPLIRYRTGDLSKFTIEDCPCGSILRRLDKIRGRLADTLRMGNDHWIGIQDLDDSIFSVPEVIDYQASLTSTNDSTELNLILELKAGCDPGALERVRLQLLESAIVDSAIEDGVMTIGSLATGTVIKPLSTAVKRAITDQRKNRA